MEKKRRPGGEKEAGAGGDCDRVPGAPFASVEDLSDDSPPGEAPAKLEVPGYSGSRLTGPQSGGGPPRIDISRASSSSHHEDSSPERELFAGEGGGSVKVGLGFTEDMALELRSSTEELDFHEAEPERRSKKKKLHQQQAVIVTKYELDESEKEDRERKDSGCSEGGLLYIGGGRSSRLSSIGSAASGGSGVSASSAVSHLSAASNYSRASRCSSPHRMLLETSFCGPKPIPTLSLEAEYPPSESVEATLLKRKADPAGAILPNCLEVGGTKPRRTSSERTVRPSPPVQPAVRSSSARAPRKPAIKKRQEDENQLVRIIPLHSSDEEEAVEAEEETELDETKDGKADDYHPENGIYIPLKGPLIDTRPAGRATDKAAGPAVAATSGERKEPPRREERREHQRRQQKGRAHQSSSSSSAPASAENKKPATAGSRTEEAGRRRKQPQSPEIEETELVRFISLHGDDDEDIQNRRNNQSVQFKSLSTDPSHQQYMELSKEWPKPRARSPEPPKPGRLELEKKKNGRSLGQIPRDDSRTPSPASSFTRGNIFRRSSDSSGSSKKSLSSSDSKTKKDSRNKSMFTSLFKKNVKETPVRKPHPEKAPIDPKLTNVEYKFKQDENVIDKDTIIIPLHSPDEVVEPLIRYEPEKEQTKPSREQRSFPEKKTETCESQRTSLEMQKNIVVVDVINEDTKDHPTTREEPPATPKTPSEPKKVVQESKRRVDELEVYDFEPRVRRSSSVCSRETEAATRQGEEGTLVQEDKEIQAEQHVKTVKVDEMAQARQDEREDKRERSADTDDTLSKSESVETCREASQETVIENHLTRDDESSKEKSPVHEEDILSAIMHDEEVESLIKREEDSENNITLKSESHERRSSESEADLSAKEAAPEETDEERKGLFLQADSVDDDLPYVPTTLPQERSVAIPIIPVRQRANELVKTCPVERPRSTTPIQPANLDEYVAFHDPRPVPQEKMQITLPR